MLSKGFTLIELLIVIAVVGVLAGGVVIAIDPIGKINSAKIANAKTFSASVENNLGINQVGKWSFEEGSGITAKDTSGYGNNGTLNGGATWNNALTCGLGFGGCLSLDGTDDYVQTSTSFTMGDVISFSFWFYPTRVGNGGSGGFSCALLLHALFPDGWWIEWRNSGSLELSTQVSGGYTPFQIDASFGSSKLNSWHSLIGTITKNGPVKLYLDGNLKVNSTIGAWTDANLSLLIGSGDTTPPNNTGSYNEYCQGYIDEVAIYNQTLTSFHVQQLYARGLVRRYAFQSLSN